MKIFYPYSSPLLCADFLFTKLPFQRCVFLEDPDSSTQNH